MNAAIDTGHVAGRWDGVRIVTGQDVVDEARKYLDVRWLHQGRGPDGIDCVGSLVVVASGLGLSTFDLRDYSRVPEGIELIRILREQMNEIHPRDAYRIGDVVATHVDGLPTHVGIVANYRYGGFSLIHAFLPYEKVVEQRLDSVYWKPRIIATFRFPGIA